MPLSRDLDTSAPLQVVVLAGRYGLALLHNSRSTVYRVLMLQSTNASDYSPPNTGMQRTALCARKILAFLKPGIGPSVLPVYR